MIRSGMIVLLAVCTLTACQTGPFKKKSANSNETFNSGGASGPVLTNKPRFNDVPIPPKANENMERTYVYQSNTLEIGRLVYTSGKTINEIAQFYINTCPNYGWTLENMLQAEGVQLSFTKPGKKLFVTVQQSEIKKWKSLIILNLTPDETGSGLSQAQRPSAFQLNP